MSAICLRFKAAGLNETESKKLHAEVAQRIEHSESKREPRDFAAPSRKALRKFCPCPLKLKGRPNWIIA
jgi:hypothetical protein